METKAKIQKLFEAADAFNQAMKDLEADGIEFCNELYDYRMEASCLQSFLCIEKIAKLFGVGIETAPIDKLTDEPITNLKVIDLGKWKIKEFRCETR